MQPYLFPYLGYFQLIADVDRWIVFDTAQYTPQSWMNRNRIAHDSAAGWHYLTVPVQRARQDTPIADIRLADPRGVQRLVLNKLAPYRGRAPHYEDVRTVLADGIAACRSDRLADLNVATLAAVCRFLGIPFAPERLSELGLDLSAAKAPGDWALQVAIAIGADAYLNAPGGRELFRQEDWDAHGIALEFAGMPTFTYGRGRHPYVPHLSIIDVLMWNPRERVRDYLYTGGGDQPDMAAKAATRSFATSSVPEIPG